MPLFVAYADAASQHHINPLIDIMSSIAQYRKRMNANHSLGDANDASSHAWDDDTSPSLLPAELLRRQTLKVLQSRGVRTGGTVALQLLAERATRLGFPTVLCDEPNRFSHDCARPDGLSLSLSLCF